MPIDQTGAIDTLLRLSHTNLPKLQRIHMEGLRLELCQRAAKSFLREKLGTLDSLGTMGAFTLGQNGQTTTSMRGRDLSAKHLLHWLKVDSRKTRTRLLQATTILNVFPGDTRTDAYWRVPFHHSANLINMPQAGMFRHQDGTLQVPQSDCTLDGVPLKPEDDPEDMLDFPVLTTPWSENETQLLHQLFPSVDSLCLNFGRTGVFQWNDADSSAPWGTSEWPQRTARDLPRRLNQGGIESKKTIPGHECHMSFFDTWAPTSIATLTVASPKSQGRSVEEAREQESISSISYHTYAPMMWGRMCYPE